MERTGCKTQMEAGPQAAPRIPASSSLPPAAADGGLLDLQRAAGNRVVSEWLRFSAPVIQTKPNNGGATNAAEQQADKAAEKATESRQTAPRPSLIVEDDAKQLQPGQMRKGEFLSALRSSVTGAAEQALAGTMWSSLGCPYIDRWFGYYNSQSGAHVERALLKYAPEADSARNARDYIPMVTQRVRRGLGEWKETGEVSGLPEEFAGGEMPGGMPGATVSGLVSGVLSGIGSAVSGAVSSIGFKGRKQASEVGDPAAIQAQLGAGQSLDSGVKSKMESAFGMTFSGVRVHTDSKAHGLSNDLDARAFTIGSDIAFAAGEYQPGSLIGDALIAHELAHVAQQSGGSAAAPLGKGGGGEYSSLEEDADVSAVGAMMSTLVGAKGLVTGISRQAMPRVRSGLKLQRCSSKPGEENTKRWEEIKKVLEKIPTGKEGLKVMEDYDVSVRFVKGKYEYDPNANTVLLDLDHDIARSAMDFAHEIHHAKAEKTKTTADIKKLGREEYIKQMIDEEAEAATRAIEAKIELEGTDVDVSGVVRRLEPEFRAEYKAAVDAAKAKDPKLSEADAKKIGREAGKKRLIQGYKDGEMTTSSTKESYLKYYGDAWDEAHK